MRSRPLVALLAAACALAAAVGASAASSPPSEQVDLVPADVAMAKRIVLQKADVGPGWTRKASSSAESSTGISADSPESGCDVGVDLSKFTITGSADTEYQRKGGFVSASVVTFPTAAQAAGDLAANMNPAARKCVTSAMAKAFSAEVEKDGGGAVRFQMGATKVFPSSSYKALRAEHVYAYAISARISGPDGTAPISVVILAASRGRVAVMLFGTSVSRDPMRMATLAQKMVGRFPGHWVIAA